MAAGKLEADVDLDPPMHIKGESVHGWLGELVVICSHAEDRVLSLISARRRHRGRAQRQPAAGFGVGERSDPTARLC